MRATGFTPMIFLKASLLLMLTFQPAFATDYSNIISEEYLRSVFMFADEDQLKYSECKKKSYPTCTYVWGPKSEKDAARAKYGLAPNGNKLMIIYAQAASASNFQRVLGSYSDAEKVDGLGEQAVWSDKRNQLSLITNDNLILHVNIEAKGVGDLKSKAMTVAKYVLEKQSDD